MPSSVPRCAASTSRRLMAVARPLLAEPRTGTSCGPALAEACPTRTPPRWPSRVGCLLPLAQMPPRGVWGQRRQVTLIDVEVLLGRRLPAPSEVDRAEIVRRYLAAFGPATVADFATWSRLTGLGEVLDGMRPALRTFRDEAGRELFDLPDAPRPDPDTPAPVRFLPEYDNALLSHADRGVRFGTDAIDVALFDPDRPGHGAVLVDGMVRASWHRRPGSEGGGDAAHRAPRPTAHEAGTLVDRGRRPDASFASSNLAPSPTSCSRRAGDSARDVDRLEHLRASARWSSKVLRRRRVGEDVAVAVDGRHHGPEAEPAAPGPSAHTFW